MRRSQRGLRNLCVLVTSEAIAVIGVGIAGDAVNPNTRLLIFECASYIGAAELVFATPLLCYEAYKCCRTRNAAEPPVADVHMSPPATILSNVPASTESSKLASPSATGYTAAKKASIR